MPGPRSYTDKTLKRLFGLAHNRCSFPGCEEKLSDERSAIKSNICHIAAAKEGGERFDKDMSDAERADYDNLILLCPTHHDVTNDVNEYTVDALKAMKKAHEQDMEGRVSREQPFNKRSSLLTDVINKIVNVDIEDANDEPVKNSFSIEDKLSYNYVVSNRCAIEEYRVYQGKINGIYAEFEKSGSVKKKSVLRAIKHMYINAKGEVLGADQSLENIRKNADQLIDLVRRRLHERIDDSANSDLSLKYEEVEFAISILIVDGFLRCKILEEPTE